MKQIWILALIVSAGGCASMQEKYQTENCNYDAAFRRGMNQAMMGQDAELDVSKECLEKSRPETDKGYRDGFAQGQQERSAQELALGDNGPINRASGEWGCKELDGMRKCGYGCMVAFGKINCGRKPTHTCVEAYGIVKCGKNCRAQYGAVVCEEY